jgi:biotin transport system substrate-specific component
MTVSHLSVCRMQGRVHSSFLKEALVVMGASLLIGLLARISIPLPFTPVPLSLGPQAILFTAIALGSKRGALAAMAYVAEGLLGLPVFSGGKAGIMALVGPTGGYIVGYIAAAFVTGYIAERLKERKASSVFAAAALGNAVIYLMGMAWLSGFIGSASAFALGVAPFIILDAIKVMAFARLFSSPWNRA